jgi:hypothetical protein
MPPAFPVRWQFETRSGTARKRLAVAFLVSIILHGAGYGTYQIAPAFAAAVNSALAMVLPKRFTELQPTPPAAEPKPKREVPMVFVEVDPAQATVVPPKETRNYSTHNSIAANPEPKKMDVPKIDGTQKHVQRTMDVERQLPKPSEPAPLDPKPAEPKPVNANPKPEPQIGDLAMAKVEAKPLQPDKGEGNKEPEKPHERPRTIREAMARNPALAGAKMQQEGGVERRGHIKLDAKGSPFGNYDSVFVAIVQERWYALLDNNRFMLDRRGKVSLTFRLHYDGRITQLATDENSVGDLMSMLCQKSILDPAPFPKWPTDMRQVVGIDYRDVRFTFYYD